MPRPASCPFRSPPLRRRHQPPPPPSACATCGSGDNFVEDKTNYYGEVVDMEAYALAKVCYHYDINFISFKYITDNANEHSPVDWKDNCSDGISQFKERVLDKI